MGSVAGVSWLSASASAQPDLKPRWGVCEREAETLLGQKAVKIGGSVGIPRKLPSKTPKYPEPPAGTIGSGTWLGEVLVNASGKVTQVWPIREVRFKPPFPAFNKAIEDSIRRWEYEPILVNGTPTPFCMTVSHNANWI